MHDFLGFCFAVSDLPPTPLKNKMIRPLLVYVVVQINPFLKVFLPIVLDMAMYDNEFETIENKI